MFRILLAFAVVIIGVWVLINALITTDRERVEATVERLIELARKGGQEAADEIYAVLADDYREDPPFTRKQIRQRLDTYVAKGRLKSLDTGGITTTWKGEEILIPLLTVYSEYGTLFLTISWAERDGEWKIVDISRWRQD